MDPNIDAATVLEQFCHDAANLPHEIAHLLEEIQFKDQQIQECRDSITTKDRHIQNFVRQNGGHVRNPKEDSLSKAVLTNYDRMQALQAEKLALSEKAMVVLDRTIKRFDVKLRDLQAHDQFPADASLPSLLQPSAAASSAVSGTTTPAAAVAVNTVQPGGAPNIANAAMARMAAANSARNSPITAQNPLLNQAHLNAAAARTQRESSADAKRRRPNLSLSSLPAQSSNLRQSSTGPTAGTPKAGTPVPSSSRAGSAQPSRPSTTIKKVVPKKVAPHQAAAAAASRKKVSSAVSTNRKRDRKRHLTSPTPSSSRGSLSPTPLSQSQNDGASETRSARRRVHAASDDEPEEAEQDAEGDEIYCICQQVSFGDMVACDNEECPYQWFHWSCVGLKAEPKGDWLCPHCSDLPKDKIVKANG